MCHDRQQLLDQYFCQSLDLVKTCVAHEIFSDNIVQGSALIEMDCSTEWRKAKVVNFTYIYSKLGGYNGKWVLKRLIDAKHKDLFQIKVCSYPGINIFIYTKDVNGLSAQK